MSRKDLAAEGHFSWEATNTLQAASSVVVEWVRDCFSELCFPRFVSGAKLANLVLKRNKTSFQAVFSMTLHDSSMANPDLQESNHSLL